MFKIEVIKTPEVITVKDKDEKEIYKFKPYIKRDEINKHIKRMALEIKDYYINNFEDRGGQDIILVCVINGAIGIFKDMVEELYELGMNCEVDTFKISTREGNRMADIVEIKKQLSSKSIKDKILIFIEDIVDTGVSLNTVWNDFKNSDAREVLFASLFFKREIAELYSEVEERLISVGKNIEKEFIIGCWLDYKQLFRGLPDVWIMFDKQKME